MLLLLLLCLTHKNQHNKFGQYMNLLSVSLDLESEANWSNHANAKYFKNPARALTVQLLKGLFEGLIIGRSLRRTRAYNWNNKQLHRCKC